MPATSRRFHWVIACRPSDWQSPSSTNPEPAGGLMPFPASLVRRGLPLLAGGILILVLAGCNKVKQSDYDALKAQLNAKVQELAAAQQKVADLQKQLTPAAPASGPDETLPIFGARKAPPMDPTPLPATLPIPVPTGLP